MKSKILFKMTGSIACFKACSLISKLIQAGHEVQVVASESALKFIGEATLEGLTNRRVATDLWQPGQAMDHIRLMRWADIVVVAPASANFINKIAAGIGNDLLTTLFLAHDFQKPYVVVPAMNTTMYQHPVTQKSIRTLQGLGVEILETASGVLACGEVGLGKLLEPEIIFNEIESHLKPKASLPIEILVTGGGTQEPIDQVRVITNKSTGKTSAEIVDVLSRAGMKVTFLHSSNSVLPAADCTLVKYEEFRDLEDKLKNLLSSRKFQAVIHASAVSDFSIAESSSVGKISSETEKLNLVLKKNPKLVSHLREYAGDPNLKVIAFKMTAGSDAEAQGEAVKKLFAHSRANLVIHNDISDIDRASHRHVFHWCEPDKTFAENLTLENTHQLALRLVDFLKKDLL